VGARSLRVGTALLLVVWGTVDQTRYYLALRTDDLHDLERAAALDSFDSSLQMRLARRATEDGQPQQAEAAWRRAVQANPADPGARQGLLRFLIDQNRFDEALDLTDATLKYTPKDPNLLVDRGLLALQKGHADTALASWDAALAADPDQLLVHLFLAQELDREGKARAAASHYVAFLEKIARQRPQDRPAADKMIAIVFADGTVRQVLSLGREACRADRPEQAGELGGCQRCRASDQGWQGDGSFAALSARVATGPLARRQQRECPRLAGLRPVSR
jgi:tetratricopeptide (TPR) repeat protein